MTVLDQAAAIPGDWQTDLALHLDHGWVYSSPTAFGLARIVDAGMADEDLADCSVWVDPDDLDDPSLMWYFTRVAGNVAEVLSRLPFPLSQAGWHRQRGERIVVHRHDFRQFARRFRSHPQPIPGFRECGFHAIQRGRG